MKALPVDWLWEPRIPLGLITVLAGDPGLGKSLLTAHLAAGVTNGELDGLSITANRGVLMFCAEDSPQHTVIPRLKAAGATPDHVHFAEAIGSANRPPTFPDAVRGLRETIARERIGLVIIDPLMAFLGASIDSHKDHSVRQALTPIASVAEATGAAVLLVAHLNKGQSVDPLQRLGGSMGIAGAARSLLLLTRDPEDLTSDRRLLIHVKTNLARQATTLVCETTDAEVTEDGRTIETARIVATGEVSSVTGWDALASPTETPARRTEAEGLLRDLLSGGAWTPAADVLDLLTEAGVSGSTAHRARKAIGVQTRKATPGWEWCLHDTAEMPC